MVKKQIQRLGDSNDGGGKITDTPQKSVFVNGRLVAVVGSRGTSHHPCPRVKSHCAGNWQTTGGCSSVFIEGKPVNLNGDVDSCGHARTGGSDDVFVGS